MKLMADEIDPGRLMWAMHRRFTLVNVPQDRLVLYIEITDAKRLPTWCFIITHDTVDVC